MRLLRAERILLLSIVLFCAVPLGFSGGSVPVVSCGDAVAAVDVTPEPPEVIDLYTGTGKRIQYTREVWARDVLPMNLQDTWDDPDALFINVILALRDGFYKEVLPATVRLLEIGRDRESCAVFRAVALTRTGSPAEAREFLQAYIARNGETGAILVQMARTYEAEKDLVKAEEMLRDGLQLDPNITEGVSWLVDILQARGGREAVVSGLQEMASWEDSWRPQIWLGKYALENKDIAAALRYYRQAIMLARKERKVMQDISSELIAHGYNNEALDLVVPYYDPSSQDVSAGVILLQAYLNSGRYEEGQHFWQRMWALNRPDLKTQLEYYRKQFDAGKKEP